MQIVMDVMRLLITAGKINRRILAPYWAITGLFASKRTLICHKKNNPGYEKAEPNAER